MIHFTFSLRLINHNSSHQSGTDTIRKRDVFPSMRDSIWVFFQVIEKDYILHIQLFYWKQTLKKIHNKSWSNSHGLKVTKLFSPVLFFYRCRSVLIWKPQVKALQQSWMSRTLLKVLSVLKCLRLSANLHTGGSAVDSNGERTLIRLLAYPGLSLTGFLRRLGWSQCWDAHNKSVCSAQLTCVRPVDVLGESALTSLIRLGQIWRRKMRRAGVREPNTHRGRTFRETTSVVFESNHYTSDRIQ